MSALLSWPTLRRWPLLFALLLLTAPAFADSITIGSLTFLDSDNPSNPQRAFFLLQLNTQGLTFNGRTGLPVPLVFDVQAYGFGWYGPFSTIPPTNTYLFPPYFCPCGEAVFNLSLLYPYPFRLANGKLFIPNPNITVGLYALPGQTYLQYGQSVAIVLNSKPSLAPEPASLLLFASGLLATAGVVWRKRRALAP
jgi:PEP-CTERM motif-containing protein